MSQQDIANDTPKFVHLHVHSQYSLLDGKAGVAELVDKAIADDMPGIALTDHGNMFGIKEFTNYVNKINDKRTAEGKEKFKPIIGCEVYVAKESLHTKKRKATTAITSYSLQKTLRATEISSRL